MPVVPITTAADRAKGPAPSPPDEPWALMAAAQMHAEGRLVQPYADFRKYENIEDRREHDDIGPIVQYPGEQLPMEATTELGDKLGAHTLDKQLVDQWLKKRGK